MCEARQVNDQMMCPCGLTWDVGDPDPPKCRRQRHVEPGKAIAPSVRAAVALDTARRLEVRAIPLKLPDEVALKMALAAGIGAIRTRAEQIDAMQAAYRVFLDSL